jgi:hypothetical protein
LTLVLILVQSIFKTIEKHKNAFQNGKINSAIKTIVPQYNWKPARYKYDTETQFWAGNEFHYFRKQRYKRANNNVSDQIQVQQFIVLCCTRTTQRSNFHILLPRY